MAKPTQKSAKPTVKRRELSPMEAELEAARETLTRIARMAEIGEYGIGDAARAAAKRIDGVLADGLGEAA